MNDQHKYDNSVQPDNKFGHTLRLLAAHLPSDLGQDGVHLDLACGFGHIAQHIIEPLVRPAEKTESVERHPVRAKR